MTATSSLHLGRRIRCSAARAYAFAGNPANLPAWAAGLGGSIREVDGRWVVPAPEGDVVVEFVPPNDYGVLDHTVVLPDGSAVYNPLRVIADGEACEVVFTLRRRTGMTDDEFDRDAAAVARDLEALQQLLEAAEA